MLYYFYSFVTGAFTGLDTEGVQGMFGEMLASPGINVFWMVVVVILGILICSLGLQAGVERITKVMMIGLLSLMIILAVHGVFLEGGMEGLKFYLLPDVEKMKSVGIGQVIAGLIIFPACFAFGVNPDSGPSLIFITLPNVFISMIGGRIWGSLFFLFMSCAAFSTVIAVFENIIACDMELVEIDRKKSAKINMILIIVLSLPCALGYNVLSGFEPLGAGSSVLDLEDFLVSNILLPLGSLVYLLFATWDFGWGFDKYRAEANEGVGLRVPAWIRGYVKYILPIMIMGLFIQGIWVKFFA